MSAERLGRVPSEMPRLAPLEVVTRARPNAPERRPDQQAGSGGGQDPGRSRPAMSLRGLVDPGQLDHLLELLGRPERAATMPRSDLLGTFVRPGSTVTPTGVLRQALEAEPLAFAVAQDEQPTRLVVLEPGRLADADLAVELAERTAGALHRALGEHAGRLGARIVPVDPDVIGLVWEAADGVTVAPVLDNPGFALLVRPGVHAGAEAAVAALQRGTHMSGGGLLVAGGVVAALAGVFTGSLALAGAGLIGAAVALMASRG